MLRDASANVSFSKIFWFMLVSTALTILCVDFPDHFSVSTVVLIICRAVQHALHAIQYMPLPEFIRPILVQFITWLNIIIVNVSHTVVDGE